MGKSRFKKSGMPLPMLLDLRSILARRRPDLLPAMDKELDSKTGDAICGAITEELANIGIGDDGEINKRGLVLEDLIDRVGRLSGMFDKPR